MSKKILKNLQIEVKKRIVRNRCQCSRCGTIIESKARHDFAQCHCGRVFTDGGHDYIHRGFVDVDDVIALDEFENSSDFTLDK